MLKFQILASAIFIFAVCMQNNSLALPKVVYHSPVTGAEFVNSGENITVRFDENISYLLANINVEARTSGNRTVAGIKKLTSDPNTMIFDPHVDFEEGETVYVDVRDIAGSSLKKFYFEVDGSRLPKSDRQKVLEKMRKEEFGSEYSITNSNTSKYALLPSTEPEVTVRVNNNPAPGTIFFASFQQNPHLVVMKSNGQFMFVRAMPSPCYDFGIQQTGLLTYFQNLGEVYYGMDSSYTITDTFYTVNGYDTDLHELIVLENGNYIIMSYDVRIVNMSKIVPGGQKDAQVTGLIIQEIDPQRNAIFQWRSWDHFEITDADSVNLSLGVIDYCHGNAIQIEPDGNLLVSCRNMSEVTKINRVTGDLMYRLGGKNNQFTFLNDTIKFSYQHAIRRTAAGTHTLYDNGNFHVPKTSRAVEYQINEAARTCTRIWEYRKDPAIYSFAMGYAERLPNGNTSVSWGFNNIAYTEVTPSGDIAYEFSLENTSYSYRVLKRDWFVKPLLVNEIPESYDVTMNYPNPFNGSTVIYFSMTRPGDVSLRVFDALGRQVSTLISGERRQAGSYNVRFDSGGINSGVYFYELVAGGQRYVRKMLLVK